MNLHVFIISIFTILHHQVTACQFEASLLSCPITSSHDFEYLNELAEAGFNIDILQENLALSASEIEILADQEALNHLVTQRGCSIINEIFSPARVTGLFQLQLIESSIVGPEFHKDYRSYQNILDQLQFYTENHPESVQIQLKTIGQSHEGRDLQVIHINLADNEIGDKPIIWIMATQHAREWIATSTAIFFIEKLINEETDILNHFEFAILPLANPDGYEYSRKACRLWRKNRRYPSGVDLNRNWNIHWSKSGSTNNPNSQVYHGPSPASEPEVQAIQNYILTLPNVIVGFDLHSFGQLILRNSAWTHAKCPHEDFLSRIGTEMNRAIARVSRIEYQSIRASDLYPASGGAMDWMYYVAGFPGFVLELRDRGKFGFELPRSDIIPVGKEIFEAIKSAIFAFDVKYEDEFEFYEFIK